MSVVVPKSSLTLEQCRTIASECYIIEPQTFMDAKFKKTQEFVRFFTSTATDFILPYSIARKYGFENEPSNWIPIQPLLDNGNNVMDIDESDDRVRHFVGELRDYQAEAVEELLEQLNEHSTTTLGLPPGWGKTKTGIWLLLRLGLRGLIITSRITVVDGWIPSLQECAPDFTVWVVGEMDMPENPDIIVCMDQRVEHIPDEIIWSVGTLILDEMHLLCTQSRVKLFLSIFPKYIIIESATLEQAKFYEMSHKIAGTHGIFKVSNNPYNIYLIKTGIAIDEERTNGFVNVTKLRQAAAKNEYRQKILLYLLMKVCSEHKIMCLRMVKDNIEEFADMIRNCGISCDSLYGTKRKCTNTQVKVMTCQKAGVGYDEKMALTDFWKNPILTDFGVFEATTPNRHVFEQARGRWARCSNPAVAFLMDDNKKSWQHIKELKPWFKETNATLIEVDFWDFVLPPKEKIYERDVCPDVFYRILTQKEYKYFLEEHILSANEHDIDSDQLRVFPDEESVFNEIKRMGITKGYVISLGQLCVVQNEMGDCLCLCPICDFHVIDVNTIE
jgi:hypothetical protein